MKNLFLTAFVAIAIVGCKEKKEETRMANESEVQIPEDKSGILEKGCYTYNAHGNTVNFEITDIGDSILGNLSYAYSGKDRNTGTFKGHLNNDKLIGDYTFRSEGVESSRQVAFMVKDNQLIEGYGELNGEGTAFKDSNTLTYSSTMPLTKTDCDK